MLETRPAPAAPRVLDAHAFGERLSVEIARQKRSPGFLSFLLTGIKARPSEVPELTQLLYLGHVFHRHIRHQDRLGLYHSRLALLMPDITMSEARDAAERLHRIAGSTEPSSPAPPALAMGLATVYGEVEGGADALGLAAKEALDEARPGETVTSRDFRGCPRVLVVDDDSTFARTLAESISERGWEGHPCSEVADARQRIAGGSYSGLFLDLVLRGGSGAELLRQSLLLHPRRPAVLMSGKEASHEAMLGALELGPAVFIQKPITPRNLDQALAMFRYLLPRGTPVWGRDTAP